MSEDVNIKPLVDHLMDLRELHEQMLTTVRNKYTCMRKGDLDGLESWSARERFLFERMSAAESERQAAVSELAEALGLEGPVTLSQLAAALDEPDRSRLLGLAGALRAVAEQIRQANQINDAVTREILQCFAQVNRKLATASLDCGLYEPNGQRHRPRGVSILNAVG